MADSDRLSIILAYYSHTSRVFNGAVTLMTAGIGFFLTLLSLSSGGATVFSILSFLIIGFGVLYGLARVVELNLQLQYLEEEIRFCNGYDTLFDYVNDKIPKLKYSNRQEKRSLINITKSLGIRDMWRYSNKTHKIGFIIWIVILILGFLHLIKFDLNIYTTIHF